MWDIDSRGGCKREVGSVQEHSVISTQFWREPKTVLKNIVYLKEKKKSVAAVALATTQAMGASL